MICRTKNRTVRIILILIDMEKKFELTDKFVFNTFGIKLFQIKCTKSFKYAKEGDLGGYVEKDENLDQESNAWVYGNAQVYGNARVYGNAQVYGDADIEMITIIADLIVSVHATATLTHI